MPDYNYDQLPEIKSVQGYDTLTLIEKLRQVPLRSDPSKLPYKAASFELARMDACRVMPAQLYLLEHRIELLLKLRKAVLAHGVDILSLNGFVTLTLKDGSKMDILPPIVEISHYDPGSPHIICDGAHRGFISWVHWFPAVWMVISNSSEPYYAVPNRGGWEDVRLFETGHLLSGTRKKWYRLTLDDPKKYYRDFSVPFNNVGGSRPTKG